MRGIYLCNWHCVARKDGGTVNCALRQVAAVDYAWRRVYAGARYQICSRRWLRRGAKAIEG